MPRCVRSGLTFEDLRSSLANMPWPLQVTNEAALDQLVVRLITMQAPKVGGLESWFPSCQAFIFLVILVCCSRNLPQVPEAPWPEAIWVVFTKGGFRFVEFFCGDGNVSKSVRSLYRVAQLDVRIGQAPGATRPGKCNAFDLLTAPGFARLVCIRVMPGYSQGWPYGPC